MKKYIYWILLGLALFGLADAAYLTYEHYADFIPPCGTNLWFVDCGRVLRSQYSLIFGVPLALIGLIHYSLLTVSVTRVILSRQKVFKYLVVILTVIGAFASGYFMYLQFIVIKSLCLYCTASAIISFALFTLMLFYLRKERIRTLTFFHGLGYRNIVKPVLFLINPEIIHTVMVSLGAKLGTIRPIKQLLSFLLVFVDDKLQTRVEGIRFKNPVGLSAGFDYDAKLTQILPSLNFGFETIGTVTNHAYEGNPPPMLGRLPKSRSLMVNKGFKSEGAEKIIERLEGLKFEIPIGISIGRTNSRNLTTQEGSVKDIVKTFRQFEKSKVKHTHYELNISCPNLYGNITFYPPKNLRKLLDALAKVRMKRPVFIKMPIEKSNREFLNMLRVIEKYKFVKGLTIGNLQKNRKDPSLNKQEVRKFKVGNFSGKPCEQRSNELIKLAYKKYAKRFTIIGVGGIFSAEDAYKKIRLGASLVALITGMIYQGPSLITEINLGLLELMEKDRFNHISKVVGIDVS